jgi:hypothetical protein
MCKKIVLFLIRTYQKLVRPVLPSSCVFHAHGQLGCSEYTYQAIQTQGCILGGIKGVWRILRCHPWQKNFND